MRRLYEKGFGHYRMLLCYAKDMLKAIIFDVGNVLIKWPADSFRSDITSELGINDEQFRLFAKKYLHMFGLGQISEEELWAGAKNDFGIREVNTNENLLGRKFESEGTVFKDVLELARSLKKRGFKIAILSNTNSVHEKVFTNKGVTDPFDHVFLSHKIGLRKPDSKTYTYALEQLGVKPSEALFIDDHEENIEAADKIGIRTVLADKPLTIVEKINQELDRDFVGTKAALIYKNEVLAILRDDKKEIPFPDYWDLPGGAREDNETPVEVVIREIKEELNINLNPNDFVWQKTYPGVVDERQTAWFLVANLTDEQVDSIVFGDEGQKWEFMTCQEFIDQPKAIEGMKTRLNDYIISQKNMKSNE